MQVRNVRRILVVAALVGGLVFAGAGLAPTANAASRWAPVNRATIHPGVMTVTGDGGCTSNFVFFQGADVFLGQAAHCAGLANDSGPDGCGLPSLPIGTPVEIEGASRPGTLVYSSWRTMQAVGEQDPAACYFNDFALVRVDPADRGKVNPTVPHWGGPTGVHRGPVPPLAPVYTLGNSPLRQGIALLQPKSGVSLGTAASGWGHDSISFLPGIPGDSGSAILDGRGRATAVLTTLNLLPLPASNTAADLSHVLQYARSHGFPNLLLALGTKGFNPNQLPLG